MVRSFFVPAPKEVAVVGKAKIFLLAQSITEVFVNLKF